jgi:pyruvate,water dikinase
MTLDTRTGIAPVPIAAAPPPGYWEREASHFPQPLSPMIRSLQMERQNETMRGVFADAGILLEGLEFREIGGWAYTRQVPLGGKDRKAPPGWLFWILVRTVPSIRRRIRTSIQNMRGDQPLAYVDRWWNEWRPEQVATLAELRAVKMGALGEAEFDAFLGRVVDFLHQGWDRHFRLTLPFMAIVEVVFACRDLLRWDDRQSLDLMNGLSTASTEPGRRLAVLTQMARERPAVRKLLEDIDEGTAARVAATDADFGAAFDAYQHEFGYRALRYDVTDPSLEEVPAFTLGLIRDQLKRGYDPKAEEGASTKRREEAESNARALLATRSQADRDRFQRALERARRVYPVREDNEFYTVSSPLALTRQAVLELGRRLVAKGVIDEREDVFFLEIDEAREAFRGGADQRALVTRRKGERVWTLANPGPASYGTPPGPPPSFDALPGEAATVAKGVLWLMERIFEAESSQRKETGTSLNGIAASPGTYTGPARVIMDETEFDKIQAGDVLVCPITSPVWSVLFSSVGALVTDTGGVLSHPAIISREYGIPAVVATGSATANFRDGQLVTVDGDVGTVTLAG